MSVPVLSTRVLNRTHLARQLLLEPSPIPVADALVHLVGLQAQEPPSPYLALRARLAGFAPGDLAALLERREAVRIVLMRSTIHLVTAADAAALRPVMQPVIDRELFSVPIWRRGVEGVDLDPVLALGRSLVDERPRTPAELRAAMAERWPERDANALAYAVRCRLPVVQATPRGLWGRSGGVALVPLDTWTGRPMGEPAPIDEVVLRYLRAFGPASVADVAAWSRLTGLREVLERLRPRLRTFRDDRGRELFDVEDGELRTGEEDAPVRFLPDFDNATLSHDDRTRIVRPDLPWPVLDGNGARPVVLVDGFVSVQWRVVGKGPNAVLELHPMRRLAPAERAAVEAEASPVLAFVEPRADPGAVRWFAETAAGA